VSVPFQQVAIFGLGLIGASMGLALKKSPAPPRVVGFDTSAEALHRAARAGAIDRSAGTLADACSGSEVIVLAAPVRAILQLLPEIAPHLTGDTLVTDTGGTKQEIVRVADSTLPRNAPFVGGHPLAGRLTAGVSQPAANLFGGAIYCLTPSPNAASWAVEAAVELVESMGAQPYFLEAGEHDGLLAAISHLPYFVSVALVTALATQSAWMEMGSMAAGGFRAASSLAEANPQMWADVAATNRDALVRQLDLFVQRLTALRDVIASGDDSLIDHLREAQAAHQAWLAQRGEAPTAAPTTVSPRPGGWMDRFRRA
jgi:prephenate dehydrogenase